jgi:hypothetical protein
MIPMAKGRKESKHKWKVHLGESAPDLRAALILAYQDMKKVPKADAEIRKKFTLSPLSLETQENALNGSMFIPTIRNKLEARRRGYALVLVPTTGSYKVGVYTCVGNKANMPSEARVVLERKF